MIRALTLAVMLAASPAGAHSWYTGEHAPGTGYRCCSGADCAPIDPRKVSCDRQGCTLTLEPGDMPTVAVAGKYRFFGEPSISPDLGSHACYFPPGVEQGKTPPGFIGVIRCLWLGAGS